MTQFETTPPTLAMMPRRSARTTAGVPAAPSPTCEQAVPSIPPPPKKPRGRPPAVLEMTQPEVDMIRRMISTIDAGRARDRRQYRKPYLHYLVLWSGRGRDTCAGIIAGTYQCPAAKHKVAPSGRGGRVKLEAQHPDLIPKAREIIRTINRADPVEQCYAEKVLTQLRDKHPEYMKAVWLAAFATAKPLLAVANLHAAAD